MGGGMIQESARRKGGGADREGGLGEELGVGTL
jgi:hypothetical protein